MTSDISETEEQKLYKVISDALLCMGQLKPNDPVDFLSRKMLELIGDDPSLAVRKKEEDDDQEKQKINENVILAPEKLALANLHQKFEEHYQIENTFSPRSFLVKELDGDGTLKVAKIIAKKDTDFMLSENKIKMLVTLDHPNVVKVFHVMEDEDYIYVILDYCEGKDIFSFIYKHKNEMTEELIKSILKQILTGVSYIHQRDIVHKKLEPANILIYKDEIDPKKILVKISGFIYKSEYYQKGELTYKNYGINLSDPIYVAPEFLEGKYDNKVDIWSIGIIAYILLVGMPPFIGFDHEIIYKMTHKKIKYPEGLGKVKKDFLSKMLNHNPFERKECDKLIDDDYFTEANQSEDLEKSNESNIKFEIAEVMANMAKFVIGRSMRRSILSYIIARKLYDENNEKLRKIFDAMDANHNGTIEKEEIYKNYSKMFPGTTEEQKKKIQTVVENADVNGNGKIEYSEFLTVMTLNSRELSRKLLKDVFDYFDHDKSGFIEAKDIKEIFEYTDISDKQIHEMLDQVDCNEDRKLSFDEFYNIIIESFQ